MMKWMCLVCSCVVMSSCMPPVPAPHSGTIGGWVRVVGPVCGATVSVWQVDAQEGTCDPEPIGTATTDDEGYFLIEIGSAPGPLFIKAEEGKISDCKADDPMVLRSNQEGSGGSLTSVIVKHIPGQSHSVMVTPFTTLAEVLGRRWFKDKESPSYREAVSRAYERLGRHFAGTHVLVIPDAPGGDLVGMGTAKYCLHEPSDGEPSDEASPSDWARFLLEVVPDGEGSNSLSKPEVRHELLLRALEHLGEQISGSAAEPSWNTRDLIDALLQDARADGRLDGKDGGRGSVALPGCPTCALNGKVLRRYLVLAMDKVLREQAAEQSRDEINAKRAFFLHVATNRDEELFGDGGPVACDITIEPQPSPWIDETGDRIDFDENGMPVHLHTGKMVYLGDAFTSEVPTVHKHINLLYPGNDNPLCWEFEVTDESFRIVADTVEFRVGEQKDPGAAPEWLPGWLPAEQLEAIPHGGRYRTCIDRGQVPELATEEATFAIALRAQNLIGQEVRRQGLWNHVPLAAPLHVSLPAPDEREEAFPGTGLEHDNLAPVIRGDTGASVMRLELHNPNQDDVYLELFAEVSGTYERTISTSYIEVARDSHQDECLGEGTCRQDAPARDDDPAGSTPLPPSLITEAKIIDHSGDKVRVCPLDGGFPETCESDRAQDPMTPGSCELRLVAGHRYTLELRASDLGFLVPEDMRASIDEISVGPDAEQVHVTGRRTGNYVRCVEGDPVQGTCNARVIFDEYQALTQVDLIDARLELQACVRPSPHVKTALFPSPSANPDESTLSNDTDLSLCWSTHESLPETP